MAMLMAVPHDAELMVGHCLLCAYTGKRHIKRHTTGLLKTNYQTDYYKQKRRSKL